MWEVATGENTATLDLKTDDFIHGALSPDGKMLALVSDDKTIKIFDVKTDKEAKK